MRLKEWDGMYYTSKTVLFEDDSVSLNKFIGK